MADNYLITGYWGEPHITPENDRGIHASIWGAGRFVLPIGERFKAEYIGNNIIRMYDGKLIDNGAVAGIPAGEYVDMSIANAGQGMIRNDVIVFQYHKDITTQVESGSFVVVRGVEVSSGAADPTLTQEDLLTDEAVTDQMPLWRVTVSGSNIGSPVQMFSVAKTVSDKADSGHTHSLAGSNLTNVLPVSKGGTGAKTAEGARQNLGITPENIGAAKTAHTHTPQEAGAAEFNHTHSLAGGNLTDVLPITKGGTGKTDRVSAANALIRLGTNPVNGNDTPRAWLALGNGVAFINGGGNVTDQPNLYGIIASYCAAGFEIFQIWHSQPTGVIYYRASNDADAWTMSWKQLIDTDGGTLNNDITVSKTASGDTSRVRAKHGVHEIGIYADGHMTGLYDYGNESNIISSTNGVHDFNGNAKNVNGVVGVRNGGTGATTGSEALKNLGLEVANGSARASGSNMSSANVSFGRTFSAAPTVIVTGSSAATSHLYVTNVTATGCTINGMTSTDPVYWVAIYNKAEAGI